jgi:hypothetical protein
VRFPIGFAEARVRCGGRPLGASEVKQVMYHATWSHSAPLHLDGGVRRISDKAGASAGIVVKASLRQRCDVWPDDFEDRLFAAIG